MKTYSNYYWHTSISLRNAFRDANQVASRKIYIMANAGRPSLTKRIELMQCLDHDLCVLRELHLAGQDLQAVGLSSTLMHHPSLQVAVSSFIKSLVTVSDVSEMLCTHGNPHTVSSPGCCSTAQLQR